MIHPELVKKQRTTLWILLALIGATVVVGAGIGYSSLSYDRLIPTLLGRGTFKEEFVLYSIRLPRIAITLFAGMALAVSGSILQGVSRNDLADPGIIGINSGAGVAVAIFFLYVPIEAGAFVYVLPLVAFIGALLTAGLIYWLSYDKNDGLQPFKLVLVGIGMSLALSGAMIVMISAADVWKVEFIAKWLSGNIWGDDWPFVLALLPWLAILMPYALHKAHRLNLLGFSEPVAIGVGLPVKRERAVLLVAAVALASAAVSATGGIAFIGLMAPHMAKGLVGLRHQLSIPVAALIGGLLLLLADTIGRNLIEPDGIPTGIMVALIGAPYFIYLLMKRA